MSIKNLSTEWKAAWLRCRFWIKDLLNGSPVGKPYRYLQSFYDMPRDKALTMRNKRLSNLLQYFHQNSKFYSEITPAILQSDYQAFNPSVLNSYPVMNKSLILENYNRLKVDESLIPNQKGNVFIQSTSGSTGTPFKVPQDTVKRNTRIAELKYYGKKVGFKSHDPLVHLRTWNKWQMKTKKQINRENIFPFDIAHMGNDDLKKLHELIVRNNVYSMRGYASSLDLFERYLSENNLKCPSLKIIFSISETLHDNVRENVKKTMECEIISQYANEECGILAQDLTPTKVSDNVMRLNHANYIFECLEFDSDTPVPYGQLGRIVITDLSNHAFPIIRYDTGDAGIFTMGADGYPVLEKLYGRTLDMCFTVSGKPLSPMAIGRIMKHFDRIAQWQFIQYDKDKYKLKVVMEAPEGYLDEAIGMIKELTGQDANIIVEKTAEIPVLASGKRKPVVNEWKRL